MFVQCWQEKTKIFCETEGSWKVIYFPLKGSCPNDRRRRHTDRLPTGPRDHQRCHTWQTKDHTCPLLFYLAWMMQWQRRSKYTQFGNFNVPWTITREPRTLISNQSMHYLSYYMFPPVKKFKIVFYGEFYGGLIRLIAAPLGLEGNVAY